jgi:hypothetical protein
MDHATPGRHPLHAAVGEQPFVTGAVAVTHAAGDHVRDGLEAAMRMIRKPADVVLRVVGAERVEHEERIEPALQRLREHARQLDAGAIRCRLAGDEALDGARACHGFGAGIRGRRGHGILLKAKSGTWGHRPHLSSPGYAATAASICSYAESIAVLSESGPIARPSA